MKIFLSFVEMFPSLVKSGKLGFIAFVHMCSNYLNYSDMYKKLLLVRASFHFFTLFFLCFVSIPSSVIFRIVPDLFLLLFVFQL